MGNILQQGPSFGKENIYDYLLQGYTVDIKIGVSPQDPWSEWKASWSRWVCAGGQWRSCPITFPLPLLHPWGGTSQRRCDWPREAKWAGPDRWRRALPVQLQHSKLCELWAANHLRQPISCAEELRARPSLLWHHRILIHRSIRLLSLWFWLTWSLERDWFMCVMFKLFSCAVDHISEL